MGLVQHEAGLILDNEVWGIATHGVGGGTWKRDYS